MNKLTNDDKKSLCDANDWADCRLSDDGVYKEILADVSASSRIGETNPVKIVSTEKGFFVLEETNTQYQSLTDGAFAPKTDTGAEYVGRQYKTEAAAKKAARYYAKKVRAENS